MFMISRLPAHPAAAKVTMFGGYLSVRTAHPTKTSLPRRVCRAHLSIHEHANYRRVRRARCEASTPGVHRMPTSDQAHHSTTQSGFTLVEMLIATALAGLLIAGLNGVIGQALTIQDAVSEEK